MLHLKNIGFPNLRSISMKICLFIFLSTVSVCIYVSGCYSECACMGTAVSLKLEDVDGQPVYADQIQVSHNDGDPEPYPVEMLDSNYISIGGSSGGTYHIWVTVGDQVWESEDIEVDMHGPDNCRRPDTKQVTVVFDEDFTDEDIVLMDYDC